MDEIIHIESHPIMDETQLPQKIGFALRTARKQRGLVMRDIAMAAGVSTGAVGNWERGANVMSMENLQAVASFLNIDPIALSKGNVRYLSNPGEVSDAEIVSDMTHIDTGPLDVEILGVAVGGDDGDFTLNGEVAGYARRPAGIAHLRKVFALHVLSDSMEPRYEPGELLYCGGRDAVAGDDVVIETFPADGETVGKAYIKRLVKRSKTEIVCKQYNPAKELIFDPYAIKNMWRVIPTRELLGY